MVEVSLTAEGLERVRSVPLVHRMPAAIFSIAGPGALQCMQGLLTNDLVKPANAKADKARARRDAAKFKLSAAFKKTTLPKGLPL